MWRNRVLALAFVGACLGLLRWLAPAPAERAEWLSLVALPLGYGHVAGAAAFARARRHPSRETRPARWLHSAFVGSSVLTLFAAYAWALRSPALQPFVLTPFLLLFAWHIAENDLALGRAYRSGLRLGPVPRAPRPHAIALALATGVAIVAFSTREGALFGRVYFGATLIPVQPWLTLDELSSAFVLYHTLSWLFYFEDRVRALRRTAAPKAVRLRRRVLSFHLVPLALGALLYLWAPAVHLFFGSPAIYFFWSALHSLDTALVRGLEPRTAAAA
jgi:hypothetical protein